MVGHDPFEFATNFILMKSFVFFITFGKIADWIELDSISIKFKKLSCRTIFVLFVMSKKILNSKVFLRIFI